MYYRLLHNTSIHSKNWNYFSIAKCFVIGIWHWKYVLMPHAVSDCEWMNDKRAAYSRITFSIFLFSFFWRQKKFPEKCMLNLLISFHSVVDFAIGFYMDCHVFFSCELHVGYCFSNGQIEKTRWNKKRWDCRRHQRRSKQKK